MNLTTFQLLKFPLVSESCEPPALWEGVFQSGKIGIELSFLRREAGVEIQCTRLEPARMWKGDVRSQALRILGCCLSLPGTQCTCLCVFIQDFSLSLLFCCCTNQL